MNKIVAVCGSLFALMCISASAAPHLTEAQCQSYPLKQTARVPTRQDLDREVSELSAVGYHPAAQDSDYPGDLEDAEARLKVEYQRDCLKSSIVKGPSAKVSVLAN
jgi:hypothetical protein